MVFSLFGGLAPGLLGQPIKWVVGTAAYAQEFKDEELRNYVQAAIELDDLRLKIRQKIEAINNGNGVPPNIACNEPKSLEGLAENVRSLVLTFCNDSRVIIEERRLDVSRFNEIRQRYEKDRDFKEQIDQFFNEIRQKL